MGFNQDGRQHADWHQGILGMIDCEQYLTVPEVAGLLQVSTKSISRWAKEDPTMPVLRIGGSVRFHKERLLRWLKAREQGAGRSKRLQEPLNPDEQHLDTSRERNTEAVPCARL